MSYSWSPCQTGTFAILIDPLNKPGIFEVCQHDERFEFYLKWDDDGHVRYSRVNGWNISIICFKTLEEGTACLAYIIRHFRENFSYSDRSVEYVKNTPIRYSGTAKVGEPIEFKYNGVPCKWKEAPKSIKENRRGSVSEADLT